MSKVKPQLLAKTGSRTPASEMPPPITLFRRLRSKNPTAIQEYMAKYGSLIWIFAKKHSASAEAAEKFTEQIFQDIWQYAKCDRCTDGLVSERTQIAQIAVRRLIRNKYDASRIF